MGYKHIYLVYPCSSILKLKNKNNTVVISDKLMIYHDALEENYPILLNELAKQGNVVIGYLNWRAIYWFDKYRKNLQYARENNKTYKKEVPVTLIYPDPAYGELWKEDINDMKKKGLFSQREYDDYYRSFESNMRYLFNIDSSIQKRSIDLFPGFMYRGNPKDLDLTQIVYNSKL